MRHPPAGTIRQHGSFEIRRMSSTLILPKVPVLSLSKGVNVYGQAIGAMSNGGR